MKLSPILLIPVFVLLLGCSARQDGAREIRSEEDLSGLVLSTSAGNYYDNKYSGRDDITLFRVNSEADGVQAVRQGIADVFVTDEVALPPETCGQLNIKLAFRGEENFDVAFAVRKGNTALDFMAEGLQESPLPDTAREVLRAQVKDLVEEPTARGFRVKLLL